MTCGPIIARELAAAARRPSTFLGRILAGVAAFALCCLILTSQNGANLAATGRSLLTGISFAMFLYCLLAGLTGTADCLSSEKREGTLGLLFLTDLKGWDVVVGKLAATSVNSIFYLLAFFPILALTFLLGGVNLGLYVEVFAAAFNLLFFSLSLGLFTSSVCVVARRSVGLALAILLALCVTPLALVLYLESVPGVNWLNWLGAFSPLAAGDILTPGRAAAPGWAGLSIALTHLYAWGFFLAACRITPRSCQHREPARWLSPAREWTRRFTEGSRAAKRSWRAKCLNQNAYLWLAAREKHRGRLPWLFLASMVLIWLYGWWNAGFGSWWFGVEVCIFFGLILQGFMKIWIAVQASEQFVEDRRCGALELLLSTPLSVADIIAGQIRALRLQFALPLLAFVALEILLIAAGAGDGVSPRSHARWVRIGAGNLLLTFLDLRALVWMSMAGAVSARRGARAGLAAVGKIVALPSILGFLFWQYYGFHLVRRGGAAGFEAVCWWFLACAVLDLAGAARAKAFLRLHFRSSAMERYGGN